MTETGVGCIKEALWKRGCNKRESIRQKAGVAVKIHLWTMMTSNAWQLNGNWALVFLLGPSQKGSQSHAASLGQGQSFKSRPSLGLHGDWERAQRLPNSWKLYEPHFVHSPAHSLFRAPPCPQWHQPLLYPGAGGPRPSRHQLPLRFRLLSTHTKTYLDPPTEREGTVYGPRGSWP